MGVMNCYRHECKNVLCDTYVPEVGYICPSCQSQFDDYVRQNNITVNTESEIKRALLDFKDVSIDNEKFDNVSDFFDKYTE